jgi:ATP-dependent Lon protease
LEDTVAEEEREIIEVEKPEQNEGAESASAEQSIIVAKDALPESLLVIPLLERPLFPKMMGPVFIVDDVLKTLIHEQLQEDRPFVGLVLKRSEEEVEPSDQGPVAFDSLHEVGVAARIIKVSSPQTDGPMQLLVQVLERFDVIAPLSEQPALRIRPKYWFEPEYETNEELKAYSVAIVDSIRELVKLNPLFKEGLSLLLDQINVHEPGSLADFSVTMTTATGDELQEVLETRNIRERIEISLILLRKEIEISKLKTQISKRIEERLSKQQREFFLKEQLKEIKKELGLSKEDSETEVEKLQARLSNLTLPDEARERVDEELEKLKLLEPSSPEFNVTRAYLDWLTVLPWGVYSEDSYDLQRAAEVLDEDHYGLRDVKDRILELISVGIIKGDLAGSIILLVGPPGVGKTSVGQSIARALDRKFYRFSLGGMRDEAEIKGHRRTYIGAMPGKFIQAIKTCKTANPLIMLDEVDKIGASFRGDPASALLEVLDPEQNRDFLDHYLDVRFDLSKVLFVCTANQLETIPRPLLDRMEVIKISGYILEEKLQIATSFLVPKQLKEHGLSQDQLQLSDEVISAIINGYAREAGVRSLENNLKKIMRKAAKAIVEKKQKSIEVKTEELPQLLGRRVFSEDKVFKGPRVGVVMGLAYTAMGGATLHIEAAPVPAKGPGFKQTGQLGGVMVESSEIAYSYVRSLLSEDEKANQVFTNTMIHMHVPAGATPKDGPSAGITMACAIYSLVKQQLTVPCLAMTGELSLSGLVMPIGGVKEKVIAAKRAEVTQLIFPEENREDVEELDGHIKEDLEFHFVETFDQVLKICFPET